MTKIRIYELAKELNVEGKAIVDFLGNGLKTTSGLEDAEAEKVRTKFAKTEKKTILNEDKKIEKQTEEPVKAEETKPVKAETAEKKAVKEDAEQPKKKKTVFLFHPENASFGNNKNGGNNGGNRNVNQNHKNNDNRQRNDGARKTDARQGNRNGYQDDRRGVIKPTVPTTAQQYRDFSREEAVEKKTALNETVEKEVVKAPEIMETPVVEKVVEKAAEPEVVKAPETTAPVRENVFKAAAEREAKKAEEAKKAAEEAKKAEEARKAAEVQEKPVEKAVSEEPVKAAEPEVKKPVRENMYRNLQKQMEEKERQARERAASRPEGSRPEGNRGQNGDRPYRNNQNGDRPFNRNNQNGDRPFNRNGQGQNGDRPFNRNGQGQNGDRPFNRNGQGQNGQRPAGGFNRNGQNGGARPGMKDADGKPKFQFSKNNSSSRPSGGSEGGASFSKADVRGTKNTKNDKSRDRAKDNNKNEGGKRAENFRNLSKETAQHNHAAQQKKEEVIKMIVLPEVITVKDLAEKMKMKPADIVKKMFLKGKMMTVNTELSYEEAEEVAMEYEVLCEQEVKVDVIEELLKEDEEDESLMTKRPPVVCVMGHVDHGKTSLLDAIRKTNVTSREAGGITQHIGAYMVECNGEKITFLDTPGHEAFTAMRLRGAQATDIAVLVVAADDGVMPQTIEAINHAKAAGVDVIVAVNKIDKPAANIERVKQELTEYELIAEDWGGSTVFVPVSAKTGEGVDSLLEMILLVTEVKELKANANREMRGLVIEAKLDKGRGPVATILVQKGTLKVGDFVSCGSYYGRIRAMLDADGNNMKTALPSTPVEILGLNGVPNAGEVCIGHKNEKDARSYADTFIAEEKKKMLAETKQKLTMDSLFSQIQAGNIKELPIVIKADVQGSVEAVRQSLEKLSNEEVSVKVIHGAVGAINESDVSLAAASNAIVIGFNVKPDAQAKQLAESESVDLRLYRVIYQAIEEIEYAMKGMLAPVYEEKILGHAEVRMTFKASGVGIIAGSYVTDGTFERGCKARLTRGKDQLFDGNVASLKRFKDDVKEVKEGFECGIVLEKFTDIMEGDIIEAYKMVQVERQ